VESLRIGRHTIVYSWILVENRDLEEIEEERAKMKAKTPNGRIRYI